MSPMHTLVLHSHFTNFVDLCLLIVSRGNTATGILISTSSCLLQHTHTHLMALCPGLPGWAGTRKVNQSGFYWSKRQWVAVASAGPYASLHLAPDRQPHQHPTTHFLQARCPSCHPTNSVKALKELCVATSCGIQRKDEGIFQWRQSQLGDL